MTTETTTRHFCRCRVILIKLIRLSEFRARNFLDLCRVGKVIKFHATTLHLTTDFYIVRVRFCRLRYQNYNKVWRETSKKFLGLCGVSTLDLQHSGQHSSIWADAALSSLRERCLNLVHSKPNKSDSQMPLKWYCSKHRWWSFLLVKYRLQAPKIYQHIWKLVL